MDKQIRRARLISDAVSKRLQEMKKSKLDCISTLSAEELQDVQQIVQLADYLFAKHEHKKHIRNLLSEFVDSMRTSSELMEHIDADIEEFALTARDSIDALRSAQARLGCAKIQDSSGINLTNSSSAVY